MAIFVKRLRSDISNAEIKFGKPANRPNHKKRKLVFNEKKSDGMTSFMESIICSWFISDEDIIKFLKGWKVFYNKWLQFKRPLLILLYDEMKSDLPSQLQRMCKFLTGSCSQSLTSCILHQRDGVDPRYHQKHNYSQMFSPENRELAMKYQSKVIKKLRKFVPHANISTLTI